MRMVLQDLFDKWNVKFYKKGTENKIIFKIARTIMRKSANLILPTYLRISKRDKKVRETAPIIVSLTSFPARINDVWKVVERFFTSRITFLSMLSSLKSLWDQRNPAGHHQIS